MFHVKHFTRYSHKSRLDRRVTDLTGQLLPATLEARVKHLL